MIFTPPSDTSVIMQSRANPPVANWILAKLLHTRRSLLRRFANISTPGLARLTHPVMCLFYRRIVGIGLAELLALYSHCNGCLPVPFPGSAAWLAQLCPYHAAITAIFGKLKG